MLDGLLVDVGSDNDLIILAGDDEGVTSHDFIDGSCVVRETEDSMQMMMMIVMMTIRAKVLAPFANLNMRCVPFVFICNVQKVRSSMFSIKNLMHLIFFSSKI